MCSLLKSSAKRPFNNPKSPRQLLDFALLPELAGMGVFYVALVAIDRCVTAVAVLLETQALGFFGMPGQETLWVGHLNSVATAAETLQMTGATAGSVRLCHLAVFQWPAVRVRHGNTVAFGTEILAVTGLASSLITHAVRLHPGLTVGHPPGSDPCRRQRPDLLAVAGVAVLAGLLAIVA